MESQILREEKRHAAYEQNEAARHALVSNEKALAMAAHRLELYETAQRVRTALEAANRAAVQAESCLAVYDSNASAAAPALRSALILACDASTSSRGDEPSAGRRSAATSVDHLSGNEATNADASCAKRRDALSTTLSMALRLAVSESTSL